MFKKIFVVLSLLIFTVSSAQAIDFTIGRGNFYVSVGDYDYLPYNMTYAPQYVPNRISFFDVMNDYGTWVRMQPFGQVWQPYVNQGWRPYTQGHWSYTQQYGPTWVGYEPWAWAGYHYGNWVFSQQFGWVWIPGNEWHPGRVMWGNSYDSIGWSPMPPRGYDYSRGSLTYNPNCNQYSYYDSDFGYGDYYTYGGPYYGDPCYRQSYYNSSYLNLVPHLWTFISDAFFGSDNYANYYYAPDYARNLFDYRIIQLTSRPIQRPILERIVQRQIVAVPVVERQLQTDRGTVKVVIPRGSEQDIREHATEVVRNVIAPAYAKKQKTFKGERSRIRPAVNKLFQQENVKPQVETVSSDELINRVEREVRTKQEARQRQSREKVQELTRVQKEGKVREAKRGRAVGTERKTGERRQEVDEDQVRQQAPGRTRQQERIDTERETQTEQNHGDNRSRRDTAPGREVQQEREADTQTRETGSQKERIDTKQQQGREGKQVEDDTDQNQRQQSVEERSEKETKAKKAKSKRAKDKEKDENKEKPNEDEPQR